MEQRTYEPVQVSAEEELLPGRPTKPRRALAVLWAVLLAGAFTGGAALRPNVGPVWDDRWSEEPIVEVSPVAPIVDAEPLEASEEGVPSVEEEVEEDVPEAVAAQVANAIIAAPTQIIEDAQTAAAEEAERIDRLALDQTLAASALTQGDDLFAIKLLLKDRQLSAASLVAHECVQRTPSNAECHKLLGTIYAKLGESNQGASEYRQFLNLAPEHPDAERVRQILDAFDHPSP